MTEGEANRLSDCGFGCNIIGGPWISTNPACKECNVSEVEEPEVTYTKKTKQEDAKIVESLENLRAELLDKTDLKSREIVFKINSCLYSEYPHNFQK